MNSIQLDSIIQKLEDMQFSPKNILGIIFFLGIKVLYVNLDEREALRDSLVSDEDQSAYMNKRISMYMPVGEYEKIFTRIKESDNPAQLFPLIGILKAFKALAYYSKMDIPKDREGKNKESADLDFLNPERNSIELMDKEPSKDYLMYDYQTIYDHFFYVIGDILNTHWIKAKETNNKNLKGYYHEAFVFAQFIQGHYSYHDPIGFVLFMEQFKLPPIYNAIFCLDEKSLENMISSPLIQRTLASFISGHPIELCDFIWNESRIIFYDQKTLKPINTDLANKDFAFTIELYNSYIVNRLMKPEILSHFIEHKEIFNNKHNQLKLFKRKDGENFNDLIFRIIKDRWGFDEQCPRNLPSRITFIAIFHFTFLYSWVAWIEDDFPSIDDKFLN